MATHYLRADVKTALIICVVIIIMVVFLKAMGLLGGSLGDIPRVR